MARHTDADARTEPETSDFADAVDGENDITRFVRLAAEACDAVEDHDAVMKVGGHHTANAPQFGDTDFDDDGMYTADDDVDVVVFIQADADAPAWKVFDAIDALPGDEWDTERGRTKAWYTSGGYDGSPTSTPPEDEADKNHNVTITATKTVLEADDQ